MKRADRANHMLYHVPDVPKAIAEFARVLKPRGRLVASTNGSGHMRQLGALLSLRDPFVITGFDLDDGASKLETHFEGIVRERYDDALEVTEPQPILDYIRSMASYWHGARPEDEVRREIEAVIEREGAFRIDKNAGVFTAVRR